MTRYRKVKNVMQPLFENEDEFRVMYPDVELVEDWRTGNNGDWILTDDEQVCCILKRGHCKNRKDYVVTVLGSYVVNTKELLSGNMPKNIYSFSRDMSRNVHRREKKNISQNEILFAKYVAYGVNPKEAYLKVFRTNNDKYAQTQSTSLLKSERVSKLVSEEIKKSLNKVGIDEEYLLDNAKIIVDRLESKDSDKLRALDMLMRIAGMFPKDTQKESLTIFQGFSNEQLKQLSNSEIKMIAHGEKEGV